MQISAGLLAFIVSRGGGGGGGGGLACNFIHLFRFHVIIRKNFSVGNRS